MVLLSHLVVFFPFCCFVLNFVLCFVVFIPLKQTTKNGHSKNPKKQKCRNTDKNSVSAVVFTNSVPNFLGWALKIQNFAENTIK